MIEALDSRIPFAERDQVSGDVSTIYDDLLADRGALPGWYKELIATHVASLNRCEERVSEHRQRASQRGATPEQVASCDSYETELFTDKEKAGFRYTDRIHFSGGEIDDIAFDAVAAVFSPREIIELTAVAAAFEFFPRNDRALRLSVTTNP